MLNDLFWTKYKIFVNISSIVQFGSAISESDWGKGGESGLFLNLRNVTSDARHKNLISLLQIIYNPN